MSSRTMGARTTLKLRAVLGLCLGILVTNCNFDPDAACFDPCPPKYPNGTSCSSPDVCASGFCVDSVCCDSACSGVCQSCIAYTNGNGSDGTCGSIKAGTDPNNECVGVCNEQSVCAPGPLAAYCQNAAECASGFCVDGVCCAESACSPIDSCHIATCGSGTGTCTDIPRACPGGNTCANDLCPGQCTGELGLPGRPLILATGYTSVTTRLNVGDIDNDGDIDVLTNFYDTYKDQVSGRLGILRNQGDGTFAPWEKQGALDGAIFSLADMNNDGWLDAVHGAYSDPKIQVQLNDGTGHFTVQVDVSLSPTVSESLQKVVTADLNNDGFLDIVLSGKSSGQLFSSISANSTSFGTPINVGTMLAMSDDFDAKDLNADGFADLVFTSDSMGTINVRMGIGDGSFGSATSYPAVAMVKSLALRDINADGKPDIIASNGTNTTVHINLGNGSLGAHTTYPGGSAKLADLNGDGSLDIMGSTSLFNNGSGSFVPQSMDYIPYEDAVVLDINGDGLDDLARLTKYHVGLAILRNQGNGAFLRPYREIDIEVKDRAHSVFVDLDGDNLADLATLDEKMSQISVRMNLGNETFAPPVYYSTGLPPESSYSTLAGADMDADGQMDLVAAVGKMMIVYLNNGGGALNPGAQYLGTPGYGTHLAIGDFNADGYPDLAGIDNGLGVMLNQGNGALAPSLRFTTVNGPIKRIVAADLNNDGYSDFVVHGTFENTVIFMNNTTGAAVYQPQPVEAFGWLIDLIAVGDVNGDSYTDVVFSTNPSAAQYFAQVSLNDGHGVFRAGPWLGYGIRDMVDVDDNGLKDFIVYGFDFLCISMNGGSATAGCYETTGGDGQVADIDGDGIPEIITPPNTLHKIRCTQ